MLGGFNIKTLIDLLTSDECGAAAAAGLKTTLLMFDYFHDVKELANKGNANAKAVLQSWADAEWFTSRPEVPRKPDHHHLQGDRRNQHRRPVAGAGCVVAPRHSAACPGHAEKRPSRHRTRRSRQSRPNEAVGRAEGQGQPVAYVGDVVGTGSSRKSATNSVLWYTGEDIPFVPNKRIGGVCLGGKIAPIFYNTMEDAGALPIECDVPRWTWATSSNCAPMTARS